MCVGQFIVNYVRLSSDETNVELILMLFSNLKFERSACM